MQMGMDSSMMARSQSYRFRAEEIEEIGNQDHYILGPMRHHSSIKNYAMLAESGI